MAAEALKAAVKRELKSMSDSAFGELISMTDESMILNSFHLLL
jgi:hypothetical protein